MKIQRFKTNDMSVAGVTNTLVVGEWGTGKTTQALNYQNTFGKGLILSGESGLQSLMKSDIDYIPFHEAEGYGYFKHMTFDETPGSRDVVLYDVLPNSLPRVGGIITSVVQTPLSHVNLRAIQDLSLIHI